MTLEGSFIKCLFPLQNVRPSVIGAACCALARHNTGAAAWPACMTDRTGVDVGEFRLGLIRNKLDLHRQPVLGSLVQLEINLIWV